MTATRLTLDSVALKGILPTLGHSARALGRNLGWILNTLVPAPASIVTVEGILALRREADHCEATDPARAARLRDESSRMIEHIGTA